MPHKISPLTPICQSSSPIWPRKNANATNTLCIFHPLINMCNILCMWEAAVHIFIYIKFATWKWSPYLVSTRPPANCTRYVGRRRRNCLYSCRIYIVWPYGVITGKKRHTLVTKPFTFEENTLDERLGVPKCGLYYNSPYFKKTTFKAPSEPVVLPPLEMAIF